MWFIWFISNILFGHHGQSKLLFCFLWFLHCRSRVMGREIVENCLLSIHLSININIFILIWFFYLLVRLDTTLCDKVCQWLVAGQWFSLCTRFFHLLISRQFGLLYFMPFVPFICSRWMYRALLVKLVISVISRFS